MVSIEQGCRVMQGFRILLSIRLEIITMWRGWGGALQPRDVAASAPQAEPRALVVVRLGSVAWTVNQRNDSEVYRHGCHPLS